MTSRTKNILVAFAGVAVALLGGVLPESVGHSEELYGIGIALIAWALKPPGDMGGKGGGAGALALIAALTLTGCGGGLAARTTACAVEEVTELADDLLKRVVDDGGSSKKTASTSLREYVMRMGLKLGADTVKCALKEVVKTLGMHGNPSGELRSIQSWSMTTTDKEAAYFRAVDLQQMFFLAAE